MGVLHLQAKIKKGVPFCPECNKPLSEFGEQYDYGVSQQDDKIWFKYICHKCTNWATNAKKEEKKKVYVSYYVNEDFRPIKGKVAV